MKVKYDAEVDILNTTSKKQLRKILLNQRCQIPHSIWQQKSQAICDRLSHWQLFQEAQNILTFTSFRQEPDLAYLWQNFPHKNWGFSRCVDQDLVWHQVAIADFVSNMRSGTFGILEPCSDLPLMDLENIDLVLIAALASDRRGYRLGYGGGFYDRWLPSTKAKKVGVMFDEFYVDALPNDPWDVKLEAIATDLRLIAIAKDTKK
ncbi:5-formyltetrahydrofolate cyclo-ligase [Pseudanabaena biceps]|nr:5-formyltetrahydrofolate cyclo-ligase [Pseudanabaena biceps]